MSSKTNDSTYWLGFDTAKSKLDYSFIDSRGLEQWYGTVVNDEAALISLLLTVSGHYVDSVVTCVVESTSTYHYGLLAACQKLDMPCVVYNPILTRQQINSSVRGKKTDRSDALIVARTGWSGSGRLYVPELYLATKHYGRAVRKLTCFATSFKQYRSHLASLTELSCSREVNESLDGVSLSDCCC
jgi:hypothetical protein